MTGETKQTTDRDEIKRWAEERGGTPASVKGTEGNGDAGILRIDFPGYGGGESLEPISWDDFFEKFEEKDLVMVYQDETSDGDTSRFVKFVNKDSVE